MVATKTMTETVTIMTIYDYFISGIVSTVNFTTLTYICFSNGWKNKD